MAANTLLTTRCSQPVLDLIDGCSRKFGYSRSEILRTGAVSYCQSLLLTDSLESLSDLMYTARRKADAGEISDVDALLKDVDRILKSMKQHLGVD